MQSPLTPQRGRIESNPREYTHKERRARDELEVMPPGGRCVPAVRRTSVDYRTHERGYLDARRMRVDFRTKSASKRPKTVRKSTLVFQPSENPRSSITHTSLVSHSSLSREIKRKTRDNYER